MSTPLPAGFASQLSYDIAAAVERQARPQPPHQLPRHRRRRRRATDNNGLPLWPAPPQVVFNYQVSLPHYSSTHFLKKAAERCAPVPPSSTTPAYHAE